MFADIPAIDVGRTRENISQLLLPIWGEDVREVRRKRLVRRNLQEFSCKGLVLHELIELQIGARPRSLVGIIVAKSPRLAEKDGRLC